jgi:hypothetical protein
MGNPRRQQVVVASSVEASEEADGWKAIREEFRKCELEYCNFEMGLLGS